MCVGGSRPHHTRTATSDAGSRERRRAESIAHCRMQCDSGVTLGSEIREQCNVCRDGRCVGMGDGRSQYNAEQSRSHTVGFSVNL